MIVGAEPTVNTAELVDADPAMLVKTASYSFPDWTGDVVNEYEVDVAPPIAVHVAPASVETAHCTDGVGDPDAAAWKVAIEPLCTDCDNGCCVIVGAVEDDPVPDEPDDVPTEEDPDVVPLDDPLGIDPMGETARPCSTTETDLRSLLPALLYATTKNLNCWTEVVELAGTCTETRRIPAEHDRLCANRGRFELK